MTTTFASTTAIPSTAVVPARPAFGDQERQALAGFLAGYAGLTREACALDLRQFTAWCARHSLRLFDVRRAGIECFGRDLEAAGRARATVTRRLCAIAGFYRYAVRSRKTCSATPRPSTSAGPGWTMSPMPPGWTATRSARCSSRPDSARQPITP